MVNSIAQSSIQEVLEVRFLFTFFCYWFGSLSYVWDFQNPLFSPFLEDSCGKSFGTQQPRLQSIWQGEGKFELPSMW